MKSVTFEEANVKIAEHQEEYETLHAYADDLRYSVAFCFELNKEELKEINETGKLWIKQLTFGRNMQPIALSTTKTDLIEKT